MNVSAKQIAASVTGAVAAAILASVLSQKGTIIGVAIGSVAATLATALVGRSIERTHEIVRTAVKEPAVPQLVRRFSPNRPLEGVSHASESGSDSSGARHRSRRAKPSLRLKRSWQALVALTVVIFIAGAVVVTAIEAMAQEPISTLVGSSHARGFSVNNLVTGGSPSTPSTTVATTTTSSSPSTTAQVASTTTTTVRTTTTTAPSASTTSTSTTTTSTPQAPGLTVP